MAEEDVFTTCVLERTTPVVVRCPGRAHVHGEACVICDAERDGLLEVLLTCVERDALCCAQKGLAFDALYTPRLVKLGLLERSGGRLVPTAAGREVVATYVGSVS